MLQVAVDQIAEAIITAEGIVIQVAEAQITNAEIAEVNMLQVVVDQIAEVIITAERIVAQIV